MSHLHRAAWKEVPKSLVRGIKVERCGRLFFCSKWPSKSSPLCGHYYYPHSTAVCLFLVAMQDSHFYCFEKRSCCSPRFWGNRPKTHEVRTLDNRNAKQLGAVAGKKKHAKGWFKCCFPVTKEEEEPKEEKRGNATFSRASWESLSQKKGKRIGMSLE